MFWTGVILFVIGAAGYAFGTWLRRRGGGWAMTRPTNSVPQQPGWYWWRPLDRTVFFAQVDLGWRPVLLIEGFALAAGGGWTSHLSFSIGGTGTSYRVGHPDGEPKWEWGPAIPAPPS